MFNQTIAGAHAPLLFIDRSAEARPPRQLRIAAHMPILLHGAAPSVTWRIIDGCAALYQELPNGRRLILDILGPGRLLGETLVDTRSCKAMALTSTSFEPIDADLEKEVFDGAVRQLLSRAQAHALLLGRKIASERVATALLDLADQFARRPRSKNGVEKTTFTLPLMRADLADWLGLTLETVSRRLSAFKRARLIAFTHPEIITIRDRTALEAIATGNASVARAA